jgi:MFS transporter, YNFM family, putative membrane transport protein
MPPQPLHGRSEPLSAAHRRVMGLLAQPRMRATVLPALCMFLVLGGMFAALGPFLSREHGLEGNALLVIRAVGLPVLIAAPLLGARASARRGLPAVVQGGLVLAAAGLLMCAVAPGLGFVVAGMVVVAGGVAASCPALFALASSFQPPEAQGAAASLMGFLVFVGASFGQPLGSSTAEGGYRTFLCAICLCALIAAAVLGRGIRRGRALTWTTRRRTR